MDVCTHKIGLEIEEFRPINVRVQYTPMVDTNDTLPIHVIAIRKSYFHLDKILYSIKQDINYHFGY